MRIPTSPAVPRHATIANRARAEALVTEGRVTFLRQVAVTLILNDAAVNGWDETERRWRDQMGLAPN